MGRYIEHEGRPVYKYRFAVQDEELHLLADKYNIGEYIIEKDKMDTGDGVYVTLTYRKWHAGREDIRKLKKLRSELSNDKTRKDFQRAGKKALLEYIETKNDAWKDKFKDTIEDINKSQSKDDFPFANHADGENPELSFNIMGIYSEAVEKEINCDYYFLAMLDAIIRYTDQHPEVDEFVFDEETIYSNPD